MTVRRARPEEWAVLRELRLRALADAPDAFASKLADEAAAPEEMWRRRADGGPGVINLIAEARGSRGPAWPPAGADGPTATGATTGATTGGATTGATTGGDTTTVATTGDGTTSVGTTGDGTTRGGEGGVGMATVRLEPDAGGRAHLVGMWVDPGYRGHGVAMALLDHAVGWARERGAGEMVLWVADHNTAARRLYERAGFVATGDRQPLPSNPALPESMLRLDLSCGP
jgi:GNAT superfamily N-acetyltransferase